MKILFVCTGNICRSPLAEGILKDKVKKRKIIAEIDSAGLEYFHVGDPPDKRAIEIAKKHNIDISHHRGRLFTTNDFTRFDKIFIMDPYHYTSLAGKAGNDKEMEKVDYIMNVVYPGQNLYVLDPWYDGLEAFENVYKQLEEACEKIADWISQ